MYYHDKFNCTSKGWLNFIVKLNLNFTWLIRDHSNWTFTEPWISELNLHRKLGMWTKLVRFTIFWIKLSYSNWTRRIFNLLNQTWPAYRSFKSNGSVWFILVQPGLTTPATCSLDKFLASCREWALPGSQSPQRATRHYKSHMNFLNSV